MMTYWISNPSLKIVIIMWGWCSVITIVGSKTSIRPTMSLASVTLKCYGRWLLLPHGVVCFLSNAYYLAVLTISFARPLTKRQCALIEALNTFENVYCFKNANNTDSNINDSINNGTINNNVNDSDGRQTDKRLVLYLCKSYGIFLSVWLNHFWKKKKQIKHWFLLRDENRRTMD